jgi:FSR family fosmidomycin resistance protein-like MFS transporter
MSTRNDGTRTAVAVLAAISFCHLLNDLLQGLIPAVYPILKTQFALSFGQIGLITLTYQIVASLLQPMVGHYTDRHPLPYSLPVGMGFTFVGMVLLGTVTTFPLLLLAASLVGVGSAVFHPESSRVARMASGGRHGLAQSVFQVGGNTGGSLGPLLAAFIVVPFGRSSISWFGSVALLAIVVLVRVGHWYGRHHATHHAAHASARGTGVSRVRTRVALAILVALMFSKFFYLASIGSYYTFFLIHRFGVSVQHAQVFLFILYGAGAVGTIIGGPIGDRFGRKHVIWWSILGVLPFTLALPYASLGWTAVLSVCIGLILSSAMPAILVYGQDLMPGRVGLISGLFFGLAFGMGGLGAAVLGNLADRTSIDFVYHVCAFLPAIGLLAAFLPDLEPASRRPAALPAEPDASFS